MKRTNFLTNSGFSPRGLMLLQHISVIVFTSLFLFCGVARSQDQQDDTQTVEVCDAQILTGGYGYSFSGFSGPFAGPPTPSFLGEGRVGAVGLLTFDGAGGLTARDTLARTLIPAIRHTGSGTYSVNDNCTGHASIDLTGPDSNGKIDSEHLEFNFMIVPGTHGPELSFIVTHQTLCAVGDTCTQNLPEQTGVALSIGDKPCRPASLQGTYRLLSTGTNLTRLEANANVGFRNFDGNGNITDGADTGLANGVIMGTAGRTGTYIVHSDCTGTETRNDAATFDLVVVDEGRQAYVLRTGNLAITNVFFKRGSGRSVVGNSDTTPHSDASVDDDSGND